MQEEAVVEIKVRIVNGDFWSEDDKVLVFGSMADAIAAGDEFLEDATESGLTYVESDIEIVSGEEVVSLSDARSSLGLVALADAADEFEAIAGHGLFDPAYLRKLAKMCRVATKNFGG